MSLRLRYVVTVGSEVGFNLISGDSNETRLRNSLPKTVSQSPFLNLSSILNKTENTTVLDGSSLFVSQEIIFRL